MIEHDECCGKRSLRQSAPASTGDAGDKYLGLDRFGRVVDQKWATSTGTALDEYSYTHDRDVTLKRNALQPPTIPAVYGPYDEGYTYDSLNRLTAVARAGSDYQSKKRGQTCLKQEEGSNMFKSRLNEYMRHTKLALTWHHVPPRRSATP